MEHRLGDYVSVSSGPEFSRTGMITVIGVQYMDRETESRSRDDGMVLEDSQNNKFIVFPEECDKDPVRVRYDRMVQDAQKISHYIMERTGFPLESIRVFPEGTLRVEYGDEERFIDLRDKAE